MTVLYHQFGTILLGLLHEGQVVLNPQHYRVAEGDVGFVISRSAEKVQAIYDMFTQAETFQRSIISVDCLRDLEEDITGDPNVDGKAAPSDRFHGPPSAFQKAAPGARGGLGTSLRSTFTRNVTSKLGAERRNSNSDTFPSPYGMTDFEKAMRGERNTRQRRNSKTKLFAKSGRSLGLKAISQSQKSQKRRHHQLMSNSVEVRRPKIVSGNSIHDIFGSMSKRNAVGKDDKSSSATSAPSLPLCESKVRLPKTPKLSTVGEGEEGEFSGDTHTPTPVRVTTWSGGIDADIDGIPHRRPTSPIPSAKKSRSSIRSARLLESMAQNEDICTMKSMRTKDEVIIDSCYKMRGHIIAAGNPKNMIFFLSRLRSKSLNRLRRIVVLCNDTRDWELLSIFPRTYLVRGSAITFADLDRVAVQQAHHVVFFGDDTDQFGGASVQNTQELTNDLAHLMSSVQMGKNVVPTRGSDDQVCICIWYLGRVGEGGGGVLFSLLLFSLLSLSIVVVIKPR